MSSFTDMANTTTNNAPRLKASNKPTEQQQLQNQKMVFLDLQFFLCLLEYTNLRYYCQTCPLLFNKYNKYLNYKINNTYSYLYYTNNTIRTSILERIANPLKHLYLDLIFYSISVKDLSVLGNVYYLNLCACNIMDMCDNRIDLSALENVYSLNLSSCRFFDIIKINKIHTLNLARCFITNVSMLKDVCVLNLHACVNVRDVSPLRNVRFLCLKGCRITDVSALENVDTLDLSYCNYITNVSPLWRVRVLDLSFSPNITRVDALVNVSVLNVSCSVDDLYRRAFNYDTFVKLKKTVPTLEFLSSSRNCPRYMKFRKTFFGMFDS